MAETLMENDPRNRPDYQRPEVVEAKPDLDLMLDLLAGTRRMWSKNSTYIYKWKEEADETFEMRSRIEQVFEGLGRTLAAAVGMLYARNPELKWNGAPVVEEQWDNIDGLGTKGDVFAKRFSEASIRDGLGVILVDHPPPPAEKGVIVTSANEDDLGLRPNWAFYPRANVYSWFHRLIDNQTVLTRLVLYEPATVEVGDYGVGTVERYRVLRLQPVADEVDPEKVSWRASWEVREKRTEGATITYPVVEGPGWFTNKKGEVANRLPVAIAYTGRSDAPLTAKIPLLGVAWANLGHYQIASNLRFYADLSCFPQAALTGELATETNALGVMAPGRLRIGPLVAIHLRGDGAGFEWKMPPADGFVPVEKRLLDKEQAMGKMGMSFLVTDTRAAETAEAKRLDATAENSTLATAAVGLDDAMNEAFVWHAWYLGVDKASAPTIAINKDFEANVIDAPTMAVYVQAVAQAGLPPRLLLEAWQKGGRLPADADLDEIEAEMLANAQEIADQKQAELELKAAGAQGPQGAPPGTPASGKKPELKRAS